MYVCMYLLTRSATVVVRGRPNDAAAGRRRPGAPQRRARAEARVAAHHKSYDGIARHERSLESELVLGRCRHQGWEPRGECSEGREGSSALDSHGEGVI